MKSGVDAMPLFLLDHLLSVTEAMNFIGCEEFVWQVYLSEKRKMLSSLPAERNLGDLGNQLSKHQNTSCIINDNKIYEIFACYFITSLDKQSENP